MEYFEEENYGEHKETPRAKPGRKLTHFTREAYNIQLGYYHGRLFWVVPEFQIYVAVQYSVGERIPAETLAQTYKSAETKLSAAIAERIRNSESHPTPLREYHPASTLADQEVSIPKAAKVYGVSEATIRRRCERGNLPASRTKDKDGKPTGHWKITLFAIAEDRRHLKLPRKAKSTASKPGSTPSPTPVNEESLRAAQAAKILGVSRSTLWRKVKAGEIQPYYPTGGREGRFLKQDILQIKEHSKNKPDFNNHVHSDPLSTLAASRSNFGPQTGPQVPFSQS